MDAGEPLGLTDSIAVEQVFQDGGGLLGGKQ
jgi:hypothetical protein